MSNMSQNTHQKALFSKPTRGRKSMTVPIQLDYTGHNPVMVVENLRKDKVSKKGIDYKEEQHLFAMVEQQVDIVHELAREPDIEYEYNGVAKQEFARMVRFIINDLRYQNSIRY